MMFKSFKIFMVVFAIIGVPFFALGADFDLLQYLRKERVPIVSREMFDGPELYWGENLETIQSKLGLIQVPGKLTGTLKGYSFAGVPITQCDVVFHHDKMYRIYFEIKEKTKTRPDFSKISDIYARKMAIQNWNNNVIKKEHKKYLEYERKIVDSLSKLYGAPIDKDSFCSEYSSRYIWEDDNSKIGLRYSFNEPTNIGSLNISISSKDIQQEIHNEDYIKNPPIKIKYVGSKNRKIVLAKGSILEPLEFNCSSDKIMTIFPDAKTRYSDYIVIRPDLNFCGTEFESLHLNTTADMLGSITFYTSGKMHHVKAKIVLGNLVDNVKSRIGAPKSVINTYGDPNKVASLYRWEYEDNTIMIDTFNTTNYRKEVAPSEYTYCTYISIYNGINRHKCP